MGLDILELSNVLAQSKSSTGPGHADMKRAMYFLRLAILAGVYTTQSSIAQVSDSGCELDSAHNTIMCASLNPKQVEKLIDIAKKSIPGDKDKTNVSTVLEELNKKTMTELYAIKVSESDDVCSLTECRGISGSKVAKFADAVLNARDKEQAMQIANTNNMIAISGGIIAVLSFALGVFNVVTALKGKKEVASESPGTPRFKKTRKREA